MSKTVEKLIAKLFVDAEIIRSQGSHQVPATLKTVNLDVPRGHRRPLVEKLLGERVKGGTMLFVNTREQVDEVAALVGELGHRCVIYRGEMDKVERRKNLQAFREGKVELLVSTDLAGRGLDVDHVGRVINVHLPQSLENYLHRVGRTARAGRAGVVVNLVTERDRPLMLQVQGLKAAARS